MLSVEIIQNTNGKWQARICFERSCWLSAEFSSKNLAEIDGKRMIAIAQEEEKNG